MPEVRVGGDITFLVSGAAYTVTISSTGQTFNYSTDGVRVAPAVVINEVAWPGSAANSADEWIELYNTTGGAINLTGWKIVDDAARRPTACRAPSRRTATS